MVDLKFPLFARLTKKYINIREHCIVQALDQTGDTTTSLGDSDKAPMFRNSNDLKDQTSLHWVACEDTCLLFQPGNTKQKEAKRYY